MAPLLGFLLLTVAFGAAMLPSICSAEGAPSLAALTACLARCASRRRSSTASLSWATRNDDSAGYYNSLMGGSAQPTADIFPAGNSM